MKFFVLVFSFFICVKPSFAENGLAQGVQCEQQIISLIDQAKRQIDIAVFSFNRQSIIEALVKARQRGVEIRLMTDRSQLAASKNMEDISRLLNSGVDVRVSTHKKGLMHTKMAIFDGLSQRLNHIFSKLTNRGKLTELEIKQAMREIRVALL